MTTSSPLLTDWLRERTIPLAGAQTRTAALHADLVAWCVQHRRAPCSKLQLGAALRLAGYPSFLTSYARGHSGIALRPVAGGDVSQVERSVVA